MLAKKIQEKYRNHNIPWRVHFELTHRCNLNCVHCYLAPNVSNEEVSLFEVKRILDQVQQMGAMVLTLSGGEIFLRDDLLEIISYAAKSFLVILLTNGTLITSDIVRRLKKLDVTQVEISLHGANARTHDQITRVPGSHSKTMKALDLLSRDQVPIVIKSSILNQNIHEYPGIEKIASQFGARLSISQFLIPKTDGSTDPLFYRIDNKDREKYLSPWWAEKSKEINWNGEKGSEISSSRKQEMCNAGRSSCSISPSGMVSPCVTLPLNLGSLREKPFKDIWHTRPSEDLKKLRSATLSDLPQCKNCDISAFCTPCLGVNYLECGNMLSCPAEFCRQVHWMVGKLIHT